MTDLKIACPHCRQRLAVPAEMLGEVTECPACRNPIQLPSQPESGAGPGQVSDGAAAAGAAPQAPAGIFLRTRTLYALAACAVVLLALVIGLGVFSFKGHARHGQAAGATLSGTVTYAKDDGTQARPRASVMLAPSESPAAGEILALLKGVQECSESLEQFGLLERQWQLRDPRDGAAVAKLAADKKSCDARVHTLWMGILVREAELIPQATALPRIKTNADGLFAFADTKPGRYVLYARAQLDDQQLFWVKEIHKTRAGLSVSFENSNACAIRR